jgi:ribosomal-protein-alanine N-acetyltransferase
MTAVGGNPMSIRASRVPRASRLRQHDGSGRPCGRARLRNVSALLDDRPQYRVMTGDDLDPVIAIENAIYPHPWTRGNFSDSLAAGYHCWILEAAGEVLGYSVMAIAAGEAHLLNLSIAGKWQRRGLGREMLRFLVKFARDFMAQKIYLEVRPSNMAGRALYARAGFTVIATRRDYYPAASGREDAVIMELELT